MTRRCKNDRYSCRLSDEDEKDSSHLRQLGVIFKRHILPITVAFATDIMTTRRKNDRYSCRLSDGSEFLKKYIYILNIYKPPTCQNINKLEALFMLLNALFTCHIAKVYFISSLSWNERGKRNYNL